jgi:hypothetical protein
LVAFSAGTQAGAQCLTFQYHLSKKFEQEFIAYRAKQWSKPSHTIESGWSTGAKPEERKGRPALGAASRRKTKTRYDAFFL